MTSPLIAMREEATAKAKAHADQQFSAEEIVKVMGNDAEEFLSCMATVEAIISDPRAYTGAQAIVEANRLAALRTKIGIKSQMYKTAEKSLIQRQRKDIFFTLYHSLEENINCLKLLGKYEMEVK